MKAVGYKQALPITEADSLLDIELPIPQVLEHDLLVNIKAIAVNPVDYKVRARDTPSANEDYRILGWDAAGVVAALGSRITDFKVGDEVYYSGAINRSGCNGEFQAVDSRIVAKKPHNLSFADAAAIPLTAVTAWEALFERLDVNKAVKSGVQSILIIGAAGGFGSIAVQLLKALTKLIVIGTASRPESIQWLQQLGVDYVINHKQPLLFQLEQLNIVKPSFVFPTAQTDKYLPQIVELIQPQGRIAAIDSTQILDVASLKTKSLSLHWELASTRTSFNTDDLQQQGVILAKVAELLEKQIIKTTKTKEFSGINAKNLKQTHALLESGTTIGKIVLTADW